jgi:uncharacterized protein (TIGR03435 family)
MLQALLEERFKLKLHRDVREIPVYVMTVSSSGLKVQQIEEGSCDANDGTPRPTYMTPDAFYEVLQPGQKPHCSMIAYTRKGPNDPNETIWAKGVGMTQFASVISRGLDRPVIDKTGIAGMFNFRVQFGIDQATTGYASPPFAGVAPSPNIPDAASAPAGPSIFTAMPEQLGLKLEPARGPGEFIVIDHVEKPSEN